MKVDVQPTVEVIEKMVSYISYPMDTDGSQQIRLKKRYKKLTIKDLDSILMLRKVVETDWIAGDSGLR